MGKNQETKKIKVKELRKEVQQRLAVALADYKNGWPDEKYNKTLKRASKLFVTDLERVEEKGKDKTKKKKAEKKVEEVKTEE
ncbi:MAG: hypothetical protein ACHQEB_00960 [Chitinophagales bacterium]